MYLHTAGLLVNGTAAGVCASIVEIFRRARVVIGILREDLGDLADALCPLVDGGVEEHKLRNNTHDTCNTANAQTRHLLLAKIESGKRIFGEEGWASRTEEQETMTDTLCGNHTRGLPVVQWNRNFENHMNETLGPHFEAAAKASGSHARLEKSGLRLLRSLTKLVYDGVGAYAKGDGLDIRQ